MNSRPIILLVALCGLAVGCDEPPKQGWERPPQEFRDFRAVYPTLARDCGFHACHGTEERFFRVFGPGRARLDPDTKAFGQLTGDEASGGYTSALSMIDLDNPGRSLLLRKPLAVAAGGSSHEGVDDFGRDVYRTVNDEGYLELSRFVLSMAEEDE